MVQGIAAMIENCKQERSDKNGRYRSWEHCYVAFASYREDKLSEDSLDSLSLHLSFYLASWGMYRGSSFLLQKDYRVHAAAIKELMRDEYAGLWALKCENAADQLGRLFALANSLEKIYSGVRSSAYASIKRGIPKQSVSDTLITKILMGTLGCVPAYDQYFCAGMIKCGIKPAQFKHESIENLSRYYVENSGDFENWRQAVSGGGVEYPQMKMLDMYFWQIGKN